MVTRMNWPLCYVTSTWPVLLHQTAALNIGTDQLQVPKVTHIFQTLIAYDKTRKSVTVYTKSHHRTLP